MAQSSLSLEPAKQKSSTPGSRATEPPTGTPVITSATRDTASRDPPLCSVMTRDCGKGTYHNVKVKTGLSIVGLNTYLFNIYMYMCMRHPFLTDIHCTFQGKTKTISWRQYLKSYLVFSMMSPFSCLMMLATRLHSYKTMMCYHPQSLLLLLLSNASP